MVRRIDHVSIAVGDLEKGKEFFIKGLGGKELYCESYPAMGFRWTTIELGTSCFIELIDPVGSGGFLDKFLETHGEGLHHITVQVDDLQKTRRILEERGIETFGHGEPFPLWKEMYVHPRNALGTLIQFAEFDPLAWINPGYIPASYKEFTVAPPEAAGKEPWEVRKVKGPEGPLVEIRQGERVLRLSQERLADLIQDLKNLSSP